MRYMALASNKRLFEGNHLACRKHYNTTGTTNKMHSESTMSMIVDLDNEVIGSNQGGMSNGMVKVRKSE